MKSKFGIYNLTDDQINKLFKERILIIKNNKNTNDIIMLPKYCNINEFSLKSMCIIENIILIDDLIKKY